MNEAADEAANGTANGAGMAVDSRRCRHRKRGTLQRMTAPFRGSESEVTRQRLRGKAYVRLSRDVYVLRGRELDLRARVEAARLVFPESTVCLATSAGLLNLPVDDDGIVHLDRGPGPHAPSARECRCTDSGFPPNAFTSSTTSRSQTAPASSRTCPQR